ncbi:MAG: DUF1330 domain-containing protein [Burkholderiales bacterium]|jgi:uncharacterized protein (DUF1330 family)
MAAYILVDCKVTDPVKYEDYKRLAQACVQSHGGKYLVRGAKAEVLEGSWTPNRVVVLEFPTLEQARAFHHSADYVAARALREGAAQMNMIVVGGA